MKKAIDRGHEETGERQREQQLNAVHVS